MKYLIALAFLGAGQAFAQQSSYNCQRVDSLTVNCESSGSHLDTSYRHPDVGASEAQGIANAQTMANGQLQAQSPQQQIEQQRLQNELLRQQLETQRQAMAAQSAQQDHEMRLDRLQRSLVTAAACLKEHTAHECESDDSKAARDDITSGRISQSEFLRVIRQTDPAVKASH